MVSWLHRDYKKCRILFLSGPHMPILSNCCCRQAMKAQRIFKRFRRIPISGSGRLLHSTGICELSTCIDASNNSSRGEFEGTIVERLHRQEQLKKILDRLDRREAVADAAVYAHLLRACTSLRTLSIGRRIHDQIVRSGIEANALLGNLLVQMYIKNGSFEEAQRVVSDKCGWGLIMWTMTIAAYAQKGHTRESLHVFQEMLLESSVLPDSVVFLTALSACRSPETLAEGKMIHACICESDMEKDVMVSTALVNMYARCGSLEDARKVFERISQPRNVVTYTTMIAAYAESELCKDQATQLFRGMQQEGVLPDKICFVATLNACGTSLADLANGKLIHACVVEAGLESNTVVATALVNMYGNCGWLEQANAVFGRLLRRDVVSWTAIISAYSKYDQYKEAIQLFREMNLEGTLPNDVGFIAALDACGCPDALPGGKMVHACIAESGSGCKLNVGNAVIKMYARCCSLEDAWEAFKNMGQRNAISWTTLVTTLVQHDRCSTVIQLFKQMQLDGVMPDKDFFIALLNACASLSAVAEGKLMHARIVECGFASDANVGIAIVNMYGKCGNPRAAHKVFDGMLEREAVAWTAIIAGYAHHGHADEALLLFWKMQQEGEKPDSITLLCILSVCCHAGLLDQGCDYFIDTRREFGLELEESHYGCMIDLLGRAGNLEAAELMINKMPIQPNVVKWMTLLAGCKVHGDIDRGKRAAEKILKMNPHVPAAYVVLSNIYAAAERWDDVERVRREMEAQGVHRDPGSSSLEVDGRVDEFIVGQILKQQREADGKGRLRSRHEVGIAECYRGA